MDETKPQATARELIAAIEAQTAQLAAIVEHTRETRRYAERIWIFVVVSLILSVIAFFVSIQPKEVRIVQDRSVSGR